MSEVLALDGIEKGYKPGTPGAGAGAARGVADGGARARWWRWWRPRAPGKSTLLHIAGLLDTPDAGRSAAGGARDGRPWRPRADRGAARRAWASSISSTTFCPNSRALENIMLPQLANGVAQGAAEARADGAADPRRPCRPPSHRPAELSGGEQQRVAFCRALANAPRLLLADEPTGNLDPGTSDQVFGALMEVVRETGLSALIATHNMALAARMDRVVRLEQGRVV